MQEIQRTADEVAADVRTIQQSMQEIDEIVEVINGIADQTNMLTLNASIEAAHAGEAGKGFVVVAEEVKSLAVESRSRASEIEGMVNEIQYGTESAVESLDRNNERIEHGIESVDEAMDIIEEIHGAVVEVSDGIAEVASATDQQAASTEEVASVVDQTVMNAQEIAEEANHQTDRIIDINPAIDGLETGVDTAAIADA